VYHHVTIAMMIVVANVRNGLQQLDGLEKQIVKVHGVCLPQPRLIEFEDARDLLPAVTRVVGHVHIAGGRYAAVLRPAYRGQNLQGSQRLVLKAQLAHYAADDSELIIVVVDREVPVIWTLEAVDVSPQNSYADRVKRGYQRRACAGVRSEELRDPRLHLA